jgi:C4-dicarboxylate-specific signal transduction histidine kinase
VLLFLLYETTVLYWRLARSHVILQRERDNRLLNFEAIAAAFSHEVKQPLAAISANVDAASAFLRMAPPDFHEAGAALNDVSNDIRRTTEVLDGIRSLFGRADQRP